MSLLELWRSFCRGLELRIHRRGGVDACCRRHRFTGEFGFRQGVTAPSLLRPLRPPLREGPCFFSFFFLFSFARGRVSLGTGRTPSLSSELIGGIFLWTDSYVQCEACPLVFGRETGNAGQGCFVESGARNPCFSVSGGSSMEEGTALREQRAPAHRGACAHGLPIVLQPRAELALSLLMAPMMSTPQNLTRVRTRKRATFRQTAWWLWLWMWLFLTRSFTTVSMATFIGE